ncbi:MAG TPA: S8 family serine peptidase, partial [Verrucomicrobiae bacterium]|nr:S8 family serine peptidase [Verrucomicrobiae bacterium]
MLQKSARLFGGLSVFLFVMMASGAPHKLRVTDRALAQSLLSQGARFVADYGDFEVLEADPALAGASTGQEIADQLDRIELKARLLDTRKPEIQSLRKVAGAFSGRRLHLIQFGGPVKPEWLEALKQTGVQVLNFVPHDSYLVYGDSAALQRLQSWAKASEFVQWEGPYAPEYKIHPRAAISAAQANAASRLTGLYAVQIVDNSNENTATLALIDRIRVGPLQNRYRALHFLNLIVRLPEADLALVAAQADVVFIASYQQPTKSDERQDQIIAGNLSGGLPSGPGYLAWLASKGFTQAQFDLSGFLVDLSDSGIDNGTNWPAHFGLYAQGKPSLASRIAYNRFEGTITNTGSTLQGCDGHGTLNAHIIGGYCAFGGFPFADSGGFAYGLGVCPFARMGSSVIFDPQDFTYPDYPTLQSDAYNSGARISNNSWGHSYSDGAYDSDAQAFDALVRDAQPDGSTYPAAGNQPMVIVFSAGNEGPGLQTVTSPSSAKNVITVGASENVRSLSTANRGADSAGDSGCANDADITADSANDVPDFSSRGPCADGRMKPDVVAPGTHITGGAPQLGPASTNGTGTALPCFDAAYVCALPGQGGTGNPYNFFPLTQQLYTVSSGTSISAPAVAGACALVRQYFINTNQPPPSPAMTKAFLINSCRYLNGVDANDTLWSPSQGMGEINLGSAFDGVPRILRDQVAADKFTASLQTRTITGTISESNRPLRITLAWTDAPGSPIAAKALVNDLDLTLSINGVTYIGNVFSGSNSVPGGTADSLNNVESIFLPAGFSGNFIVTIKASSLNGDGVPNEAPDLDQDFALVIYNAVQTYIPIIVVDAPTILAENCTPPNGALDPGETLTMAFPMRNIGTLNTTNLVATLLQSNNVAFPSAPAMYGALLAGGSSVTQAFSFTAGGTCGGSIQPVFQLQEGTTNLGTLSLPLTLGALIVTTGNYSNATTITIPTNAPSNTVGPSSPFPSSIIV